MGIMPDITKTVTVIGLIPDVDQLSGQGYTQIHLGIETIGTPIQQQMMPYPGQRISGWKYLLSIYVPTEKWNNQYKMWQKYDLVIKDTGELELKLHK